MLSWTPRLAALVLFALPVSAQSTVQLMLDGFVTDRNGAAVDIEFAARGADGAELQPMALHMVLLPNTTAFDLVALLDARLGAAKIRHVAPAPVSDPNRATLFVEGVTRVQLRVSDGLRATIGLPEGAPSSVLLMPPLARSGKSSLLFHGITNDARLRKRGNVEFSVDFQPETTPTLAVESLANACARANWLSERPTHETWKPSPSFEGLELVGTSFTLDTTQADWGLELHLP
jgi:hypothetical protein